MSSNHLCSRTFSAKDVLRKWSSVDGALSLPFKWPLKAKVGPVMKPEVVSKALQPPSCVLIQQSRAIIDFSNNIEMSSHWDKMKKDIWGPRVHPAAEGLKK